MLFSVFWNGYNWVGRFVWVCERGGNSRVYRTPHWANCAPLPCHTATAARVRMRKIPLATMVSKMRLTPLFHYILVKTLFNIQVPRVLGPTCTGSSSSRLWRPMWFLKSICQVLLTRVNMSHWHLAILYLWYHHWCWYMWCWYWHWYLLYWFSHNAIVNQCGAGGVNATLSPVSYRPYVPVATLVLTCKPCRAVPHIRGRQCHIFTRLVALATHAEQPCAPSVAAFTTTAQPTTTVNEQNIFDTK